jgi:hypothetical protein
MPKPTIGESRNHYISRCIEQCISEGLSQDQALGKCEGMADEYGLAKCKKCGNAYDRILKKMKEK